MVSPRSSERWPIRKTSSNTRRAWFGFRAGDSRSRPGGFAWRGSRFGARPHGGAQGNRVVDPGRDRESLPLVLRLGGRLWVDGSAVPEP